MPEIDRCRDCGEHRPMSMPECWNCTPAYDEEYDRAQTIAGAKARYVEYGNGYSIGDFERDVARILAEGEYPDKIERGPLLGGQVVTS